MGECDVEDILCQLNVLNDLRSLRNHLGDGNFAEKFPEFEGAEGRLEEAIAEQRGSLESAIARCGNIEEDELETEGGSYLGEETEEEE